METVKEIIINLAKNLESEVSHYDWPHIPIENFLRKDEVVRAVRWNTVYEWMLLTFAFNQSHISHRPRRSQLFDVPETSDSKSRVRGMQNYTDLPKVR